MQRDILKRGHKQVKFILLLVGMILDENMKQFKFLRIKMLSMPQCLAA